MNIGQWMLILIVWQATPATTRAVVTGHFATLEDCEDARLLRQMDKPKEDRHLRSTLITVCVKDASITAPVPGQ